MKGDRVQIVVDVGGGGVQEFDVTATKAGRRVEVVVARGTVEVSEVTRSGQPVRSARFMASRVVALVEHPATNPASDARKRQRGGGQLAWEVATAPGAGGAAGPVRTS